MPDMLILRTLLFGPAHGHQIAKHIHSTTDDILRLEQDRCIRHSIASSDKARSQRNGKCSGSESASASTPG